MFFGQGLFELVQFVDFFLVFLQLIEIEPLIYLNAYSLRLIILENNFNGSMLLKNFFKDINSSSYLDF